MTRQTIIERTIRVINQLPQEKAAEISDFAEFVIKKYEEQLLRENIQQLVSDGASFNFLKEEDVLYSVTDLKKRFHE